MGPVRVLILDDDQSILDGYQLRLGPISSIEIVAALSNAEELEALLDQQQVDVLLLDVVVPTSSTNASPYPILHLIPRLLVRYSDLRILVISMHSTRALISRLIDCGVSGYILKDDPGAIQQIGAIVLSVAAGGTYFSQAVFQEVMSGRVGEPLLTARQAELLSLCAAYPNETTLQLAERLSVAHSTVHNLFSSIYTRLGVANRTAALVRAQELELIPSSLDLNLGIDLST